MKPRLLAAGVALAWIAASMLILVAARGVPLRLRGLLVLAGLAALIALTPWLRRRRRT